MSRDVTFDFDKAFEIGLQAEEVWVEDRPAPEEEEYLPDGYVPARRMAGFRLRAPNGAKGFAYGRGYMQAKNINKEIEAWLAANDLILDIF